MRRLLIAGFIACLTLTVLLVAGIFASALLGIWSSEPKWGATAFACAFLAIATGGSAAFILTSIKFDYPKEVER